MNPCQWCIHCCKNKWLQALLYRLRVPKSADDSNTGMCDILKGNDEDHIKLLAAFQKKSFHSTWSRSVPHSEKQTCAWLLHTRSTLALWRECRIRQQYRYTSSGTYCPSTFLRLGTWFRPRVRVWACLHRSESWQFMRTIQSYQSGDHQMLPTPCWNLMISNATVSTNA